MHVMLKAAIAAAVALVFAGCSSEPDLANAPSAETIFAAEQYCKDQVAATFDDPSTAEFGSMDSSGVGDESSLTMTFTSTTPVKGDGQEFNLTCTVTGAPGTFLLASYQLVPAA